MRLGSLKSLLSRCLMIRTEINQVSMELLEGIEKDRTKIETREHSLAANPMEE